MLCQHSKVYGRSDAANTTSLTKGCSPNPLIPFSVLNVVSVKLIPSSVSKIFSRSMVCDVYEQR